MSAALWVCISQSNETTGGIQCQACQADQSIDATDQSSKLLKYKQTLPVGAKRFNTCAGAGINPARPCLSLP